MPIRGTSRPVRIRQLDPKITASRHLDSFQYDIVTDIGQTYHEEEHLILKALGFKTNPNNRPAKDMRGDIRVPRPLGRTTHREKLDYEIDGTVVIVNDNATFERAGIIGKAPRAAMAYKFSPREATTVVEDIHRAGRAHGGLDARRRHAAGECRRHHDHARDAP